MAYDIERLKQLAVSETGLVFDPSTGAIYTSNPVGIRIIASLREGLDADSIRQRILEEFDTDEHTAERDLFDFFSQLMGYEVIRHD